MKGSMRTGLPLIILGLLLTGCSALPSAAEPTQSAVPSSVAEQASSPTGNDSPSPETDDVAPSPETGTMPSVKATGQAWADEKINAWVKNSGIKSVKGFMAPYNLISSWEVTAPGRITVYLDDSYRFNSDGMFQSYERPEDELRVMGLVMFESIGDASPELESVTFTIENGLHSGTFDRARTGADPSDLDAWAQEKYAQWLDSMNDTYESFCGKNILKLDDYRDCIPTDPHAYIESVKAPAEGELVVTLREGMWQDNTYDTPSIPGVDFVSGNMILKINKKAHTSEAVQKLTVKTEDGSESSTATRSEWN